MRPSKVFRPLTDSTLELPVTMNLKRCPVRGEMSVGDNVSAENRQMGKFSVAGQLVGQRCSNHRLGTATEPQTS